MRSLATGYGRRGVTTERRPDNEARDPAVQATLASTRKAIEETNFNLFSRSSDGCPRSSIKRAEKCRGRLCDVLRSLA